MITNTFKIQSSVSEESESNYLCAPIPTKKICFIQIPQDQNSFIDDENLVETYKKLTSEFVFTDRSELMIKRMLAISHVSREFKHFPLEKLMVVISKEMMLSEIEIAAFSIYLDRFFWPENQKSLIIMLYVIALAVKCYFNIEIDVIAAYLNNKIPNFLAFFNSWMCSKDNLVWITLIEK